MKKRDEIFIGLSSSKNTAACPTHLRALHFDGCGSRTRMHLELPVETFGTRKTYLHYKGEKSVHLCGH